MEDGGWRSSVSGATSFFLFRFSNESIEHDPPPVSFFLQIVV